jgi:hypothetical protein
MWVLPAIYLAVALAAEIFGLALYGQAFRVRVFIYGHFVLPGDLDCFRVNAAAAFGRPGFGIDQVRRASPFMYPPPYLLLAAPLAWLNPAAGFLLWSGTGIAAFTIATRLLKGSWLAILVGLAAPATIFCLYSGQNGLFTSSLLFAALGLAASNPLVAGIAAGCLIIKPQLAILLPVCYLAARNWRAIGAAALTVIVLCLLSELIIGSAIWWQFLSGDMGRVAGMINAPWGTEQSTFQYMMVSPFIMLRSLHADLAMAYVGQALMTGSAALCAWLLWRPSHTSDGFLRLVATLCLAMLATPYAYVYDLPCIAMALSLCAARSRWRDMAPLAIFWLLTANYILISTTVFSAGALLLLVLLIFAVWPKGVFLVRRHFGADGVTRLPL